MILQEIKNLLLETSELKYNQITKELPQSRRIKDATMYSLQTPVSVAYKLYKMASSHPDHPRVLSDGARVAKRFGGSLIGAAAGGGLAYGTSKLTGNSDTDSLMAAIIGGAAGRPIGHYIGGGGTKGYVCPPGYEQDPNQPDHCIRIKDK